MRGIFQATIVDSSGNVVPNCNIEVREEESGDLVQIYDAFEDGSLLGNPFTTDEEGFQRFYAESGIYRVRAYTGAFERIWRHVIIGIGPVADEADAAVQTAITDLTTAVNALIADVETALMGLVIDSGTFVATLVGCTTSPTVNINFRRVAAIVTLWMESGSSVEGTSNSSSLSLSGIPVGIRPNNPNGRIQHGVAPSLKDNGLIVYDGTSCSVGTAGSEDSILFYHLGSIGQFTGSGVKGLTPNGFSITYGLD